MSGLRLRLCNELVDVLSLSLQHLVLRHQLEGSIVVL